MFIRQASSPLPHQPFLKFFKSSNFYFFYKSFLISQGSGFFSEVLKDLLIFLKAYTKHQPLLMSISLFYLVLDDISLRLEMVTLTA